MICTSMQLGAGYWLTCTFSVRDLIKKGRLYYKEVWRKKKCAHFGINSDVALCNLLASHGLLPSKAGKVMPVSLCYALLVDHRLCRSVLP
jgi:5-methylcytosine-specific restriction endonuclease McrA